MARRRLPRPVRIGLWSAAGLVVLVIIAGAVLAFSFDPDSLKPRIMAAVKQATGRDLTIQGHMRLGLSLQPTLVVQGVSLANPPGFSRPEMVTLQQLDVKLALIPLLSRQVAINRLVLVKPDIILETDAQGRPNWLFAPESKPTGAKSSAARTEGKQATQISIEDFQIENGVLTWRDGRTGSDTAIDLTSLRASMPSPDADLHLTMSATYNGTPFSVTGESGPPSGLEQGPAGAAWPVRASLEAAGAKLAIDGRFTQPMQARGYRMKATARIPDLAALAPLLPGVNLPPLHDVSLAAAVADTGAAVPQISDLALHVGQSDLSGIVANLKIDTFDATAAQPDQPIQVSLQADLDNAPATVTGSFGTTAALLQGVTAAPMPLDLAVQALGSNLTIKGTAMVGQDGRPSVQADVAAEKLDLDGVLAAIAVPPPAAAAAAAPTAAPARPPPAGHVIPDTPIPFAPLRAMDASGQWSIAQLTWGGATYRAIGVHLDLHGGRLKLDPMSADLPEGHLAGALDADASQPNPSVSVRLQAPSLAMQPLLAALRQPAYISGRMRVEADLHGAGTTPHAIAATLGGTLNLAMVNGTLDNRLLGSTLGSILREVNLLDLVGRGGSSEVQCFGARLDAANGIATLRSLVLVSSLLTMDGNGTLNLGAETLDLRLQPQARIAGTGFVVPLRISGSFRAPSTRSDTAAAIAENAGTVAGALLSKTNPLGVIAGALGAKQLLGDASVECGPALTAARGGGGNQASPLRLPPNIQLKLPNVGGALKQLFR